MCQCVVYLWLYVFAGALADAVDFDAAAVNLSWTNCISFNGYEAREDERLPDVGKVLESGCNLAFTECFGNVLARASIPTFVLASNLVSRTSTSPSTKSGISQGQNTKFFRQKDPIVFIF
jgi:hypothetical protein